VAVESAKSNAKRLREQDGGTLDLRRQSLRQHGLLRDREGVGPHSPPVGGMSISMRAKTSESSHDEIIKAESQRQRDELRAKEAEEQRKLDKERYSLWNWILGKKVTDPIDFTDSKEG
jgi:hypothetical protein